MENETTFVKDRCPSCLGEELTYNELTHTWKCLFCGSEFRKEDDKHLHNALDQASELRNKLNFDDANDLLEDLITKHPNNAGLYFQSILSKYGVTYVDEDNNMVSKPTLCRASNVKITDTKEYAKLKEHAPSELRDFYENKITELEILRNDIVKRASKQQPFDIFICYKKSVPGMNAFTYDSGKAREIYEKFTRAGYAVFFAEETLADFTGQEYEPVIYNALMSSNVMLVIAASDPDYVNAPWVKNEWSRFISLIETDKDTPRAIVPILCNGFKVDDLPSRLRRRQIVEYDGSFDDKISKVLKTYVKRGISTNITRNTTETRIEVKPIEVKEVVIDKRGFSRKTTDIAVSTRETTALVSCRSFLEHKKFNNVKNKASDILKTNPQSQEAAWLYFNAFIKCPDIDSSYAYTFKKVSDKDLNDIFEKLEVALQYCDERDYRTRTDIIKSIILNTFKNGDYNTACKIYSFFITVVDDKFENKLAMDVVDKLIQKIEYLGKNIKEKEIDAIKETIYNSLTKLGAKGIISVYNSIAASLMKVGYFKIAKKYYQYSLELFSADPDALWGSMLADVNASNDVEYANKCKEPHDAVECVIQMQKGGYRLSTSRRNFLMRLKQVGIELLNTSKAKKAYGYFKDVYSLIPASDSFTEIAYELAVTFSELLLLKGYFNDSEEFFKLIISEHDQLDFVAHLGILKCRAKARNNFELLAIKKSYYEHYDIYFDNLREAEEESYQNNKISRRIFTEMDTFHEEILDLEKGRSNIIKALEQASTICEKNLVLATAYDALYYAQTGRDAAIGGNKFAISDLIIKEQQKSETKVVSKTTNVDSYELKKTRNNLAIFDKRRAINIKVELLVLLISALVGITTYGNIYSDGLSDGFPLSYIIVFGLFAIVALIILISQLKEKCCENFDTENACGQCLGWYFGGGIAIGLVGGIGAGLFIGVGFLGKMLLKAIGLNLPFRIILVIPYLVYKIIDIIKKKKFITLKYIIGSIIIAALAYVAFGYILRFAAILV